MRGVSSLQNVSGSSIFQETGDQRFFITRIFEVGNTRFQQFFLKVKKLCFIPLIEEFFDLVGQGDQAFWQEDDDEDQDETDNHEPEVRQPE